MRGPQPWRTNRARVLRSRATSAEDRMWSALRGRRLDGLKFVRQYPIGPYVVDFVCREQAIVVEIDGATHSTDDELASDKRRAEFLRAQSYRIFRVTNIDVYENLDGVREALLAFVMGKAG
ncbi:MAG: endonuclease domain-containing protein [Xanthobacteraceae bacterium]|nr:endonuclease domain-containing protein [Xanthobacteraceae bacterium]